MSGAIIALVLLAFFVGAVRGAKLLRKPPASPRWFGDEPRDTRSELRKRLDRKTRNPDWMR